MSYPEAPTPIDNEKSSRMSRRTVMPKITLKMILLVFTRRQLCMIVAIVKRIVCRTVKTTCGAYGEYMMHPATATECMPK